jgi:hypothetical protein
MPQTTPHIAPPPTTASPDDGPVANDNLDLLGPAILRAERRLRILEELTDIGMELTRVLQRRVLAEDAAAAVSTVINGEVNVSAKSPASKSRVDPAGAFARLSRAVQLNLTLEIKVDEALRALQSGRFLVRDTRKPERKHREKTPEPLDEACSYIGIEDRLPVLSLTPLNLLV